jgi:hypothetical protein
MMSHPLYFEKKLGRTTCHLSFFFKKKKKTRSQACGGGFLGLCTLA